MASSKFILVVTTSSDGATTAGSIAPTGVAGNPYTTGAGAWETVQKIGEFLQAQAIGSGINIRYADTAVSASTTGTFTGDPTAGDTVTVNGVAFTARASGAVANEYNITAGSVTANAAALAASINASTTSGVINTVGASSALGVVTFFSIVPGPVGKNIPLSESTNNFTLADTTMSTAERSHTTRPSALDFKGDRYG
jgi:hypothetical protein